MMEPAAATPARHSPPPPHFNPVAIGALLCLAAAPALQGQVSWDFDSNGNDDLVITEPTYSLAEDAFGAVRVYSTDTQAQLLQLTSTESNDLFGLSAAAVGDINGDGYVDLAVGAPLSWAFGQYSGKVTCYDGLTGAVLFNLSAPPLTCLGSTVAGIGDVDG